VRNCQRGKEAPAGEEQLPRSLYTGCGGHLAALHVSLSNDVQ
jgi:hypothetical protein